VFAFPLTVAGVRTRVLQAGTSGPAVLLLHGLSARADRWMHNLDSLAAHGLRVFAIDLPGHGFADKGADFDYSASGYSRWIEQLLDVMGEEKVVIVGTSFGGLVAANFALHYSQRTEALVAVGALGLIPMGYARRQRTIEWLSQMDRQSIRSRLAKGLHDHSFINDDLVEEDHKINTSPGAAEAFTQLAAYYESAIDADAVAEALALQNATLPIQLIWGIHDVSVLPEYGMKAHELLPGSALDFIDGAGHFPYLEQTGEFNTVLLRFLDRIQLQRMKSGEKRPS
jgi:2-hydroxy-6-oxonona-2,4-dienedioate hydrolase